MLPFEPEDTSMWESAVEKRMTTLSEDGAAVIEALYKVQEQIDRQGLEFELIAALDYEIEAMAMRQLGDEMREAAESRAIEAAIRMYESQGQF